MDIPVSLHLSDLSDDEQRVMQGLYEHQQKVETSRNWHLYKRVYTMVEEALSPGHVVEKALRGRGLVCRSPRGEEYAYAISGCGYEWYQREVVLAQEHKD